MKINLEDFLDEETKIEGFKYQTKWKKTKKVSNIYFEKISVKKLLGLAKNYFGLGQKKEEINKEEINYIKLSKDLYKLFKTDPRNNWLKLNYLQQQSQNCLLLMIGIVCRDILGKEEKNGKKKTTKSPLARFVDSL